MGSQGKLPPSYLSFQRLIPWFPWSGGWGWVRPPQRVPLPWTVVACLPHPAEVCTCYQEALGEVGKERLATEQGGAEAGAGRAAGYLLGALSNGAD